MRGAKQVVASLVLCLCALGLGGCATVPATDGAPDPGLRGQWVLAGGSDTFGTLDLLGQDITLTVSTKAVSTGRSSCSNYTATIYGSPRQLWITATAPTSYTCATADQNVLQLEYLDDLRRVRQSEITATSLILTAQGVDLRFERAAPLRVNDLLNKTWRLATSATINLHAPFTFAPETGGSVQFLGPNVVEARTQCLSLSADYRQVGDELVTNDIRLVGSLPCDSSGQKAASDLTRVFENGFTFALTRNSLALKSARAGVALGFDEVGAP